jgi:hypothetical protein
MQAMVELRVELGNLIIDVQGMDKLWSLRSRLEIPLAHVQGVSPANTEARGFFDALRLMGTYIPGLISAGTFYQDGGLVFWDVHDSANAIGIDLEHERYHRLVVEVEDPAAAMALITTSKRRP